MTKCRAPSSGGSAKFCFSIKKCWSRLLLFRKVVVEETIRWKMTCSKKLLDFFYIVVGEIIVSWEGPATVCDQRLNTAVFQRCFYLLLQNVQRCHRIYPVVLWHLRRCVTYTQSAKKPRWLAWISSTIQSKSSFTLSNNTPGLGLTGEDRELWWNLGRAPVIGRLDLVMEVTCSCLFSALGLLKCPYQKNNFLLLGWCPTGADGNQSYEEEDASRGEDDVEGTSSCGGMLITKQNVKLKESKLHKQLCF